MATLDQANQHIKKDKI
jgi:hypothetical protein